VDRREDDALNTTRDDARRRVVSASSGPVVPNRERPATPADVDAAIRRAAKLAIDARDYRRARALLDVLEARSSHAAAGSVPAVAHTLRALLHEPPVSPETNLVRACCANSTASYNGE